jgi:hypothetical protein
MASPLGDTICEARNAKVERPRSGVEGDVDRYVAMTRATQQLVALTGS